MTFEVITTRRAQADIDNFAEYAMAYSERFSREQFTHLNHILTVVLADKPGTWNHFFITGAPYHGYLFRVGHRWAYWIVYKIDEDAKRVEVLRFWNASKKPSAFEI